MQGQNGDEIQRIEGQAAMCKKAIHDNLTHLQVVAWYCPDPCAINTPPLRPQV
jgi:hypothetical protein